jgi:thiamine kinase-like enzyme
MPSAIPDQHRVPRMAEAGPLPQDPRAAEADLRARLRGCAATRSLAEGEVEVVEGGLSNRAWRLESAGTKWFVRLGHPGARALGVDRASECRLLAAVAAAGLAPEVLACEPESGLLVTRFVTGATWQAEDAGAEANLRRLAGRLRTLHGLPVPAGLQVVRYAVQARRLRTGLPCGPDDERLHERAERALGRIDGRGFTPTLCHHDLHHLNVLDDGNQLWLVDWEYGGCGDPLMDLAGFLAMHELGPRATDGFLTSYGGLRPGDRALVEPARWVFDYVQWLWYRRRYPPGGDSDGGRTERLSRRLLHCDNRALDWDQG